MITTLAWTAVVALLAANVVGLFVRPLSRRMSGHAPAVQARWVFLLSVAPSGVFAIVFAAVLAPSLLSRVGWTVDHCLAHDDAHMHLCLSHPSHHPSAVPFVLCARALVVAFAACRELLAQRRHIAMLSKLGEAQGMFIKICATSVHSFVDIAWSPRIFVTEGQARSTIIFSCAMSCIVYGIPPTP